MFGPEPELCVERRADTYVSVRFLYGRAFLVKLGLLMNFAAGASQGMEFNFTLNRNILLPLYLGVFSCFERKFTFFCENLYLFAFLDLFFKQNRV